MADKKLLLRDDIRFILFSEIYHRLETPKSKRRAFGLLEAAIQCIAKKGFESVTMEMVAREAGVSRTLLRHYFKNVRELIRTAVQYIRLLFQKLVVDAVTKETRPDRCLAKYVEMCMFWVINFRTHANVWLAFISRCARNKQERDLNTIAVVTGTDRLQALLDAGKQAGVFHCRDSATTAKSIQVLIMGAMITLGTENIDNPKLFIAAILEHGLRLASYEKAL